MAPLGCWVWQGIPGGERLWVPVSPGGHLSDLGRAPLRRQALCHL